MASVACTVRWVVKVPFVVTATGVCAGIPFIVSADATSVRCDGGGVQHDQARGSGQPGPVDALPDVGLDVRRAQRHPGVGGHGGARGHARHHVERHARGGDGQRLRDDGVDGERVARDQAGDRAPVRRLGDELSGDVGGGADGRADLGAVGDQRQHRLGHLGVGDDERRGRRARRAPVR